MKVILAGPDPEELARAAYPAFAAAGMDVEALAHTPVQMAEFARLMSDALIVVDAGLWPTPSEATGTLATIPNPKVIILPQAWAAYQNQFAVLPGLAAGFTAPVSWPGVVAEIRALSAVTRVPTGTPGSPSLEPVLPAPVSVPSVPPAPAQKDRGAAGGGAAGARRTLRIGFWGTRGGAGTSTAALTAARLLAGAGRRVLLCDATGRGDLHVMLGLTPQEGVVRADANLSVCLGLPDGAVGDVDVVVDGGRARRDFNAEWVEVSRPLPEERIRRILGLPPGREHGAGSREQAAGSREREQARKIGFIRLEITE
ncbi:MAG: hypothetical protein QN194_16205 [Armatimonadota bacterium]|nr:hypothetical protein [Armatimonadota bacterium]